METMTTELFYAAAKAYKETTNRTDYLEKMKGFNHNEALISWFAMDAYYDLYVEPPQDNEMV